MNLRYSLPIVALLLANNVAGPLRAAPGPTLVEHARGFSPVQIIRDGADAAGSFRVNFASDVFPASSPPRWPVPSPVGDANWHSVTPPQRIADWPNAIPIPRPARLSVQPNAPNWDAGVVGTADLIVDVDAATNAATPAVRLATFEQVEPLPAPTPHDYQWTMESPISEQTFPAVNLDEEVIAIGAPTAPSDDEIYLELPSPLQTTLAVRLGYWSVESKGSPVKVGEFQSLDSSIFLNVDGIHSDGTTTWDYYASLLDNDAPELGLRFYAPLWRAKTQYQGYLRRLDQDPFSAYVDFDQQPALPLPGPPQNYRDMKEDQTVGEDFAIRVQQLDTSFAGRLTDHVNWRLDVWGMRKHGERQTAAVAHCFTAPNATDTNGNPVGGSACHALIQSQRIDWLTAEIEPALEACYGPVTVEYSHMMRAFTTDDGLVTRPYDQLGLTGELPYAVVPENHTQIDRLKVGLSLPNHRNAYARLYSGQTQNENRSIDRDFRGLDMRITDRSIASLILTGYVTNYHQSGNMPSSLVDFENAANLRPPIGYDRTTVGADATWRPFYGDYSLRSRLRLGAGYEYRELDRANAVFQEGAVTADNSFTKSNRVHFRASLNWTPLIQSYLRYGISFIDNPLYAAPIANTTVNTSLPTQEHSLKFGNTWSPANNLFFHGMLGLNNGWNNSSVADYTEDNYDLVFTAWYAPTPRWSLSGGLGFYTNWIDQDITLGSKSNPATLPWDYGGRSDVVNFGTTFAWTKRLTFSGTLDFVRGRDAFEPLSPWPDLWTYSDVNVETTRFGLGIDYDLSPASSLYFRYQLFDYDDRSDQLVGGTADMYLFGGAAYF